MINKQKENPLKILRKRYISLSVCSLLTVEKKNKVGARRARCDITKGCFMKLHV